ncbi:sensor kinase [Oleiphilus messinensis]|uniref:histidine kinase n=1 Tax=Oleiphilus messinensis TaxID=141451 RepID=A0A1Y0IGM2_9GAMM|nr:sensor histidine kinase [Oleiphilus messinensis]ARU59440.1 sensor kinase [Oleiphilus messinensis]
MSLQRRCGAKPLLAIPANQHNSPVLRSGQAAPEIVTTQPLLEALTLPAAIFTTAGQSIEVNSRFKTAFPFLGPKVKLSDFINAAEFFSIPEASSPEMMASLNLPSADQNPISDDEPTLAEKQELYFPQSGQSYLVKTSSFCMQDSSFLLVIAINIDTQLAAIQHHKNLHEQLFLTSKFMSVGEMSTVLAHELNQPLGAITNYLNACRTLLDNNPDAGSVALDLLDQALSQAQHAASIVSRVREFVMSKQPQRVPASLVKLVRDVIELLKLETQAHHVRIIFEPDTVLDQVEVDRVMIEQVLANLIKNAVDSMHAVPPVDRIILIDISTPGADEIRLAVKDCGCGISEAEENQLFSPFYTTKSDGLGAGLAICKSIVEYHEGRLYFKRNTYSGVTFFMELPLSSDNCHKSS